MVREFKFFKGYLKKTRFTVHYNDDINNDIARNYDVEDELVRLMSEEIAREIDNDIISRITRAINGGGNQRA